MIFRQDKTLQLYINLIFKEKRLDDLINASDTYHKEFDNISDAKEWGLTFGEHIGKHYYGESIWEFMIPEEKIYLYFIGEREIVHIKIYDML